MENLGIAAHLEACFTDAIARGYAREDERIAFLLFHLRHPCPEEERTA